MKNKKILIIDSHTLPMESVEFLQSYGFDATLLKFKEPQRYFYGSSFVDRIENIIQRVFLKNKLFINTLKLRKHKKDCYISLKEFLKNNIKYDYILVFRPDSFDQKFFQLLKKKSNKCIGYMWDALNDFQFSELKKSRPFLDDLFLFENADLTKFPSLKAKKGSNFYYETPQIKNIKKKNLISYLGHITPERRDLAIDKMIPFFQKTNYEMSFYILNNIDADVTSLINKNAIEYISSRHSYNKHLSLMAKSKVSLDLNPSYHEEFSFRVYESMYYETKLITTNKKILQFPLYRKENFLLIENQDDLEKIPEFIKEKYAPYSEEELAVYRFDNWLINVFKP